MALDGADAVNPVNSINAFSSFSSGARVELRMWLAGKGVCELL
jgi:hypothetical protein